MKRFRVFEPASAAGASDEARFVRDGFSFWAFLIPALWLLWNRLFLAAIAVFALQVLIGWQGRAEGFLVAEFALSLLLGLLVALEGPSLRAWKLRRQGWRETAALLASDPAEAELRYYAAMERDGAGETRTLSATDVASLANLAAERALIQQARASSDPT
ncbi:DUF2628 domain-containing protein [Aureimonas sp. AU40]|uniref:DUF2628 domain-containing protein n=1 Tax=Aureimonas sp. AU40 TaxID=1637747 RepID=UPI000785EC9D|nr:DUF2628 domain-containing protein [Aureimonas sp. AU40]